MSSCFFLSLFFDKLHRIISGRQLTFDGMLVYFIQLENPALQEELL